MARRGRCCDPLLVAGARAAPLPAAETPAAAPAANPVVREVPATPATLAQLRAGGFVHMDLFGYFPREARLVTFRPQGRAGFSDVACIPPTLWPAPLH